MALLLLSSDENNFLYKKGKVGRNLCAQELIGVTCNCQRWACCTADNRCSDHRHGLSSSWKVSYAFREDEDGWLTGRDVANTFMHNNSYARVCMCVCVCVCVCGDHSLCTQTSASRSRESEGFIYKCEMNMVLCGPHLYRSFSY